MKLLAVQKGDTVRVTAPGLYTQPVRNPNYGFSLLGFVASLLQQPPPVLVGPDGRTRPRPLPFLGLGLGLVPALQASGRVPKGYVRLLVYNQDSVLTDSRTQQLSAAALNSYEALQVQVLVPAAGYVTCYVGNESDVDVFFDDLTIDYGPALLVQEVEYDPTGLELAGLSPKTPGLKALNQYKFNGQEMQADLGLNWSHHEWRFFDLQLDRAPMLDPLADAGQENWSPYALNFNNAVRYNDPDGRCPICPVLPFLPTLAAGAAAVTEAVLGTTAGAALGYLITKGLEASGTAKPHYVVGDGLVYTSQAQYDKANGRVEAKKAPTTTHQTYQKKNEKTGETYSGKTSGKGTPEQNVAARDRRPDHKQKTKDGYGPADLDKSSANKEAIRGREQQLIDQNGDAQSQGGTSGNRIQGVSDKNPRRQEYLDAAKKEFGN